MFSLKCSQELQDLLIRLDDSWEKSQIKNLPFPLAYTLNRLRQEEYAWELLLKDVLHILLKYIATIAVSDYLHTSREPDFDINDSVKQMAINMSEGHWLKIIRVCASSPMSRVITELPDVYRSIECGRYTARMSFPDIGIKTQSQGILSTLITMRNKLFAHGMSLNQASKETIAPHILGLLRSAIFICAPMWRYNLVHVFDRKKGRLTLLLRGIGDFTILPPEKAEYEPRCYLSNGDRFVLQLYPIVFSDSASRTQTPSILDQESELYILNHITRKKIPAYLGLKGGQINRLDLSQPLNRIFQNKRVWEKRRDIELDSVFDFVLTKADDKLAEAEMNNLYIPERFVDRHEVSKVFYDFMQDEKSRALFVSGVSGSGKTAAVIHQIAMLATQQNSVMLLRGIELSKDIIKPKRFERWLTAELGYNGTFSDVLERAVSFGNGCFLIVLDGINEYTATGKDASLLFRALNHFLADHMGQRALKVVITARADGLNAFFPGGRLPADFEEELFFRPSALDYYTLPLLTDSEVLAIMQKSRISDEKAKKILSSAGKMVRTPQILHKISSGAIDTEDLGNLDGLEITTQFIDRRIARDSELRRTVNDLVKVMGQNRDMVLTEKQLSKKAPRLLDKLQTENNRILTTLRELELIQQIRLEDEAGHPTWSVSCTHDTIFEALSIGQMRRRFRHRITSTFFMALMVVGVLWLAIGITVRTIKQDALSLQTTLESKIEKELGHLEIPTEIRHRVEKNYKNIISVITFTSSGVVRLFSSFCWRVNLLVMLPILMLMLGFQTWSHLVESGDRRDLRMLYFGRADDMKRLRRIQFYVSPGLLLIVWTLVNIYNDTAFSYWPLLALLAVLIFVALPWVGLNSVRAALNGSPLLKEYCFSLESRKRNFNSYLRMSTLTLAALCFLYGITQVSGSWILPHSLATKITNEIETATTGIDIDLIKQYPIGNMDVEKIENIVHEGIIDGLFEIMSTPLLNRNNPFHVFLLTGIIVAIPAVIVMLGVSQVLITEIVARRYLRSKS